MSCPYCQNAKELADKHKLNYVFTELSNLDEDKKNKLRNISKTIPIIFKKFDNNFVYIGGYNEMKGIMSFKKNDFI